LEGEIAMALTGPAKTDYQRDYMRRRRAKLAQSARLDSQPRSPLPDDEQAALLEQNKELVERTTRVTRERDRALGMPAIPGSQGSSFLLNIPEPKP
jgi:hypothetical protein